MTLEKDFKIAEEGVLFCRDEARKHTLRSSAIPYVHFAITGLNLIERDIINAGLYAQYEARLKAIKNWIGDILEIIPDSEQRRAA